MADAQQQQRQQSGGVDPSKSQRDALEVQFQRIIEKARKLADEQSKAGAGQQEAEQAQLRQEFESLLSAISNAPATLDKEDVKRLKEAAFGPQTFFVTETQQLATPDRTGLLVRGNLRDERKKVYEHVCKKVRGGGAGGGGPLHSRAGPSVQRRALCSRRCGTALVGGGHGVKEAPSGVRV